jgi:GntR family transcriptional regulator
MAQNIQNGTWKPGQLVPGENEWCTAGNLSRTTVRLAFRELLNDGLIIRKQGLGTFVAEPKLQRSLNNLYSFTDDMTSAGLHPSSKVLESTIIKTTRKQAAIFEISEDEMLFRLKRIRLANEKPVLLETTCLPYYLCPGIESVDFSSLSLYGILASEWNLIPCRANETYEAVVLPQSTAEYLEAAAASPAFRITRIGYLASDKVFEYTESLTPGDRSRFTIGLNGPRKGITIRRGYEETD